MKKRFFYFLTTFLIVASGMIWGQESYKISFANEKPKALLPEYDEAAWDFKKAIIVSVNGEKIKNLTTEDYLNGISVDAGKNVSLTLNVEAGNGNLYRYAGYDFVSFEVQTEDKTIVVDNLSFTMPKENVSIKNITLQRKTISFLPIIYIEDNVYNPQKREPFEGMDVYFENMNGEIITEALYGEKVRLILMPQIGYEIKNVAKISRTLWNYDDNYLSHNPQDVTKNLKEEKNYRYEEFSMPQSNVQVYIYKADSEFHPENGETTVTLIDYNLKTETDGNGTITFGEDEKQTTANYQKQVQVNVKPNEGYHLVRTSFTYTAEGSDTPITITRTNGIYMFTMPAADVTVHAEFEAGPEQRYLVSIADIEHGTVSATPIEAVSGTTINLNVEPDNGYKMEALYFLDESGAKFPIDFESKSFLMPSSDVTVYATFVKEESDEGGITTKRYQLFLADRDFYLNDKYDAEGLVLFSRHDKRYAEVGGSFTVYYEKDGEVNAGDYRIFWSKSANGEYKEVKLDEVSGYYQIRNVQSDVYVKIYGRDGFPVSNEAIEATEARAYAQANKIIVVTHEPMDVQIVSMAGAVVGNAKVAGQQEFGNLAEGVYIVRLGDTVVKLQVRN